MSCYRPLSIPNPKLVKNNVFDKSVIEVPCGHCPSCKESKRLSWFVRLFYEWQFCKDNNGFVLYETLTYNNAHLPHIYDFFNGSEIEKHIPCFSTRDVQLFLKKVRKRLSYFGYNVEFKYFLSMEYGGRTHRPHYHILFFVPSLSISQWFFKKIVEEKWIDNGFVCAGKLNNGFICSAGALSYCSKYVCKDCYEDSYFKRISKTLTNMGFHEDVFKRCFPHVMCSKNLGIYALEFDKNNDLDNFLNGDVFVPDKDRVIRKYRLPLYYDRKIFYNIKYRFFDTYTTDYIIVDNIANVPTGVDYTPVYVLNDLGYEMKSVRAKKSLDAVSNCYRLCMSVPELPCFINKINEKFKTHFETLKEFQCHIKSQLPEEIFVSYSLVYRGCRISYNNSVSSVGHDNSYYDYMLIHNMSRGFRPLSVDFQMLCTNIEQYTSIPFIEDNYKMIRYLYYLIHLELVDIKDKSEMDYVNQKSVYLSQNIV